ncbi:MAG: Na+:H+ antiporter, NhaA family [Thermomicrobiales bacterium]|nr:Na+:H+ antiporter, NhaA family [Thermomicrobiales bacterium]
MSHGRVLTDQPNNDRESLGTANGEPSSRGIFSLREFLHNQAFGGILLLACALAALAWANSPWDDAYNRLWNAKLAIGTDRVHLDLSLRHWVNDGLMALFFVVVGLEIKRELLVGELASPRRAALPAIAALGGVLVPAGIYLAVNAGHAGSEGWGVPMATDIAFALGVLALLGDRVPVALKVFLTALAIVDDIAAVLVIALFYTGDVSWSALGVASAFLLALIGASRLGVRSLAIYGLLGIGLWAAVHESGVHATIAGVLLALTIPALTRIDPVAFVARGRAILDEFDRAGPDRESILTNGTRQEALAELEDAVEGVGAPLQRLEHALHPLVAFVIVPLFALANAGVQIDGDLARTLGNRVTVGIVLGLVLGKQIGITLFVWLATRVGLTTLPAGTSWRQIYGASWLAGIGFTMSLFVADLAFAGANESSLLTAAKLGILLASLIAGIAGWLVLSRWSLVARPDERSQR